jgi:hypothetical protein
MYLAGGTGLAAHLGHRTSEDLDFFSTQSVDLDALVDKLSSLGELAVTQRAERTRTVMLDSVKVQLFDTPNVGLIEPTIEIAGLRVASIIDIAAMKLAAIVQRGALRDYFDLYAVEQHGLPLDEVLDGYLTKFQPDDPNAALRNAVFLLGGAAAPDVAPDPIVPISQEALGTYWAERSARLAQGIAQVDARGDWEAAVVRLAQDRDVSRPAIRCGARMVRGGTCGLPRGHRGHHRR